MRRRLTFAVELDHQDYRTDIWPHYVDAIDFHVKIIEYTCIIFLSIVQSFGVCNMWYESMHFLKFRTVRSISGIMDPILFNIALLTMVGVTLNLYAIELSDSFSVEAATAIFDLLMILMGCFAYFVAAEHVTSALLEIDAIFHNSPWYRLTAKQLKLLVVPMQQSQRVVRFSGLGFVDLSLAAYSSVRIKSKLGKSSAFRQHFCIQCLFPPEIQIIRTAWSYFLIIRQV